MYNSPVWKGHRYTTRNNIKTLLCANTKKFAAWVSWKYLDRKKCSGIFKNYLFNGTYYIFCPNNSPYALLVWVGGGHWITTPPTYLSRPGTFWSVYYEIIIHIFIYHEYRKCWSCVLWMRPMIMLELYSLD